MLLASLLACASVCATEEVPKPKKPPTVVVVEKNEHAAVGALIGAGITYWLMRRHHKRHAPTVVDPAPTCGPQVQQLQETVRVVEERLGRAVASCGK